MRSGIVFAAFLFSCVSLAAQVAPAGAALGTSTIITGPNGGLYAVVLSTAGTWTAESSANWIHLSVGSFEGSGSSLIRFTADAATAKETRSGTVTIAGRTLTVTQAGRGFLTAAPIQTVASTGFAESSGLVADSSGRVYVSDSATNTVLVWTRTTGQITPLTPASLDHPAGLALDGNGKLYIADRGHSAVRVWDLAEGHWALQISGAFVSPTGLAFDAAGNLFISDPATNAIYQWSASSHRVSAVVSAGLDAPAGIAVDARGFLLIADAGSSSVLAWNAETRSLSTAVSSGLTRPTGVTVDGQGNVYIADGADGSLKIWNPASQKLTAQAGTREMGAFPLAVTSHGSVLLGDPATGELKEFITAYAGPGSLIEPATGSTVTVTVIPGGIPFAASGGHEWLSTVGPSEESVNFTVAANPSAAPRASHIHLLGIQIPVTQQGAIPSALTKSSGEGQSSAADQAFGAPLQLTVLGSTGDPIQAAQVDFTVVAGNGGAGGTFPSGYSASTITDTDGIATAPSLTGNATAGNFTVVASAGGANTVFALANVVASLGMNAMAVSGQAGAGSVLLQIKPAGSAWTASSSVPWIHLSSSSMSGAGNGLIQFTYDANTTSQFQTGTITVAGQNLSVTQAGSGSLPIGVVSDLLTDGLNLPYGMVSDDQGNLYIADSGNDAIKIWRMGTQQLETLVSAGLNGPHGIALDSAGNVYIADTYNNAIKKWTAATQQVTTLVSSGLNFPVGVGVDLAGNVTIADFGNNAVKRWDGATHAVTTLASSGLNGPAAIAVDGGGSVYIADYKNNAIKKWNPGTGDVVTVAFPGINLPSALAIDGQGNLNVADGNHNALKQFKSTTMQVGTLVADGLYNSFSVTWDKSGNYYAADTGAGVVKKISQTYLTMTPPTLMEGAAAGTDSVSYSMAPVSIPFSATSDQSWLTVSRVTASAIEFAFTANLSANRRTAHILVFNQSVTVTQNGNAPANITKLAGDNQMSPLATAFSAPLQVTVTDSFGAPVAGTNVNFVAVAGMSGASASFSSVPSLPVMTGADGVATAPVLTANSVEGTFTVVATAGSLSTTFTLSNVSVKLGTYLSVVTSAAGSGTVLLSIGGPWTVTSNAAWLHPGASSTSGSGNAVIQFDFDENTATTARTGVLTIAGALFQVSQAGTSFISTSLVNSFITTGLKTPQSLSFDSQGSLYIADSGNNAVKKYDFSSGQLITLVAAGLNSPAGVAVDGSGNVYISDAKNNQLKKWSPSGGVSTIVSSGLSYPYGVGLDKQSNVYLVDSNHNAVKELVANTGTISSLISFGLSNPRGLAVDAINNVYVADGKNNAVKMWNASTGAVSTLIGFGLTGPSGVAVDGLGNVYIADTTNRAVRRWNVARGQLDTIVSTGLYSPSAVALDTQGRLYVADSSGNFVRQISFVQYSVPTTARSIPAQATNDSIPVSVLPDTTPITATRDQGWITINGTTNGSVSYSATANLSINSRSAHITVFGSQQVTITQAGEVPASIVKAAGNSQSIRAGGVFATALQARIKDALGNVVQNAPVKFTVVSGAGGAGASFAGGATVTVNSDSSGIATAPALTANSIAGSFTVQVSCGVVSGAFSLTNTP